MEGEKEPQCQGVGGGGGKMVTLTQDKSRYRFTCIQEPSMVHSLQPNKEQEPPGTVAHTYDVSMHIVEQRGP